LGETPRWLNPSSSRLTRRVSRSWEAPKYRWGMYMLGKKIEKGGVFFFRFFCCVECVRASFETRVDVVFFGRLGLMSRNGDLSRTSE